MNDQIKDKSYAIKCEFTVFGTQYLVEQRYRVIKKEPFFWGHEVT